jgi:putative FmdB family regulatory protein
MPLYEYKCKKCGHRFEKIVKFSDPPIKKCPKCKGTVEQLISSPAIQFKGTGWYVTDYAGKSAPPDESGKESKSSEQKADEKSDAKSAAKADAKSDAKATTESKDTKKDSAAKSAKESKGSEKSDKRR